MRKISFVILLTGLVCTLAYSQTIRFDKYFIDKTMRIDYYHIGDATTDIITLDRVYQQGIWAGSEKNLIDNFNNGRYYVKIYDAASNTLIYSKGFDSYFGEYQTSQPALDGIQRTFQESAIIPYPKNKILFTMENRNRENQLQQFFSQEIDPNSVDIVKDDLSTDVKVYPIVKNGDPHVKVDIAILGEGYTVQEEKKFEDDLARFTKIFFTQEPYKSYPTNFNIYGVLKYSEQSGTDEPRANIFKNTAMSTTFNSMGSERYLLTEDNRAVHNIAAHVPYDAIMIMVNSKRYGGGGIYNFYLTFTSDNQWYEYVFLHEFGHSFTGLADEYYTSSTAYNDFYPRGIEPTEPNITALLNPPHVKWEALLTPRIEIPTPWEKAEFDKMDNAYQKTRTEMNDEVARLKRERAPKTEIEKAEAKSEQLSRENAEAVDKYLRNSKYWGKVGAFEGAGYSSEGLYRSMLDCIMFTKGKKPFCKVCEQAVYNMIMFYSE
jgi:hypothetical protein